MGAGNKQYKHTRTKSQLLHWYTSNKVPLSQIFCQKNGCLPNLAEHLGWDGMGTCATEVQAWYEEFFWLLVKERSSFTCKTAETACCTTTKCVYSSKAKIMLIKLQSNFVYWNIRKKVQANKIYFVITLKNEQNLHILHYILPISFYPDIHL